MKPLRATTIPGILATLCLPALAGCGGGSGPGDPALAAGQPPQGPQFPQPPPPSHVVQGEVFSFDTGMIPNAAINIWVETPGFGYSYWWANGPLHTDALGQFEAHVPDSTLRILAFIEGFVQPCGVRVSASGNAPMQLEARVEMQPLSHFNSVAPSRPQLSTEPALTGMVYESTSDGRVPIPGAGIWAETGMEIPIASTLTDLSGSFYACNLTADTWVHISKEGYENRLIGPLGALPSPWDIGVEMRRSNP